MNTLKIAAATIAIKITVERFKLLKIASKIEYIVVFACPVKPIVLTEANSSPITIVEIASNTPTATSVTLLCLSFRRKGGQIYSGKRTDSLP